MLSLRIILAGGAVALACFGSAQAQDTSSDDILRGLGLTPSASAPITRSLNGVTRGLQVIPNGGAPTPVKPGPVTPAAAPSPTVALVIRFEKGSAHLRPESFSQLNELINALRSGATGIKIGIIGHTDATGSDDYNLKLSRERAAEVSEYLIDHGAINPTLLYIQGLGKRQMAVPSHPDAGENRIVEIQRLS